MDRQQSRISKLYEAFMDKCYLPAAVGAIGAGALSSVYGWYNLATTDIMESLAPYTKEAVVGGPVLMGLGGIALGVAAVLGSRDS